MCLAKSLSTVNYSQGINKMVVFEKTNNTYPQPDQFSYVGELGFRVEMMKLC
jgi:hypothetical protein